MGKRISFTTFLFSLIFIFAFSIAYSQEMEYKEYKVMEGDTLWDISTKEIHDPFLWPKIWKENPEIKNPDRISPAQTIKIPLRLLQKEQPLEEVTAEKAAAIPEPVKEEQKKEVPQKAVEKKIEPVKKNYLADKDLLIASGYITDYIAKEIKSVGKITGAPTGRSMFGNNDYMYIKTNTPANAGDKFHVIRPSALIKHPKTKNKMGYLISVLGTVKVIETENGMTKAVVTKAYGEMRTGDLLDAFYEIEPVMEEDEHRKPDVSGFIVAAQKMKSISAFLDILFIDKGSSDGLEIGDMLKTISFDKLNKSRTIGVIQIINLKGSTASAIVRKSESTISVGDEVTGLK
ncbi:MAG: LysM peptidoglycan-binding domain-containing protein [Thermodesulfovibrionales bacterium]|nr:LysM peptidoglycan-binding domain-containing protein [Thermodesulfovibrionales bacterium]